MTHKLALTIFLLLVLSLSACSSASQPEIPPTSTVVIVEPVEPIESDTPTTLPTSTETIAPTETSAPTATATFTETPTITSSFTATQFLGFNDAYVYESWASFEGTNFYFIVPGVKANYYGLVDGFPMTCESDSDAENLLVCFSEENLFGTDLKAFEFYADEALTIPVYEGEFSTYLGQPAPTEPSSALIWPRADYTSADVTWGYTPPGCSERGINFSCEIEYRLYSDGACLVGMSCFDSCGFYYSVDTIKHKEGDWISWGPCW